MKQKVALVLSGGGAKGCFEIGAWKALREAGFIFEAVAGASVGSLNAAFVAQDDFEKAQKMWNSISINQVVNIPPQFIKKGLLNFGSENVFELQKLNKVMVNGRFDSAPLERLIKETVDEKKIRSRDIDFGIVTYNITRLKPLEIFLDQIPKGQVADYLLASASFPAFKSKKIDGKKFIDGGIHDNIPFRMIKRRGYQDIVIIDVSGLGHNRRPDITGTRTLYIKNSLDFGSISDFYGILNFDPRFLQNFQQLGYLDAKKALGKLKGKRFFVDSDIHRLRKMDEYFLSDSFFSIIENKYFDFLPLRLKKMIKKGSFNRYDFINELLDSKLKGERYLSLSLMESAAFASGLEVLKVWELDEMLGEIREVVRGLENYYVDSSQVEVKEYVGFLFASRDVDKRAKQMYMGEDKVVSPFMYQQAAQLILGGKKGADKRIKKGMLVKFPQLLAAWLFIEYLKGSQQAVFYRKLRPPKFLVKETF